MGDVRDARAPDGVRLYAIGDVHGCLPDLEAVHSWIEHDLNTRPIPDFRIIHVGDYIDRGSDCRGVIDFLIARSADPRVICLLGNHDEMLTDFMAAQDVMGARIWLTNGGRETLERYGIRLDPRFDPADPTGRQELAAQIEARVPAAHRAFLAGLRVTVQFGGYFFVHAGVRPGVPLDAQAHEDLIWIREEFLTSDADFGAVVVHGHTPTDHVTVRPNRIGIDTGAVFGGELTCLVLEDADRFLLKARGRVSLR